MIRAQICTVVGPGAYVMLQTIVALCSFTHLHTTYGLQVVTCVKCWRFQFASRYILSQTIVAWMHQRWVWHTTAYSSSSHVVFYDELKVRAYTITVRENFEPLIKCNEDYVILNFEK